MSSKTVYFQGVSEGNQEHFLERTLLVNYLTINEYLFTNDLKKADVVICDTCLFYYEDSIKTIDYLNNNRNSNALFIVTGVLSSRKGLIKDREGIIFLLNEELDHLDSILGVTHPFNTINQPFVNQFGLYSIYIAKGCYQDCTFCVDKYGFGQLRSLDPDDIIALFKRGLEDKHERFSFVAQNTAIYGWDIGTNLAALLNRILKISGNYRIGLDCMNPEFLSYADELRPILKSGKIDSMRISLITVTDRLIKLVGKDFKMQDFMSFLSWMERYCSTTKITLILIIGYPGESFNDFKIMLEFILRHSRAHVTFTTYEYKDIYFAESYHLKDKLDKAHIKIRSMLVDIILKITKKYRMQSGKATLIKKRLSKIISESSSYDEIAQGLLHVSKQLDPPDEVLTVLSYKTLYMIEVGGRLSSEVL